MVIYINKLPRAGAHKWALAQYDARCRAAANQAILEKTGMLPKIWLQYEKPSCLIISLETYRYHRIIAWHRKPKNFIAETPINHPKLND